MAVANAYYIHPIIAEVARDFSVDAATIGLVPALNQVALALGIFLLLPLGDRLGNRSLCMIFSGLQAICLTVMALAQSFALFLSASTLLGFVTIAPYLLPAYASRRVAPDRLGHITSMLTAGIIVGILIARTGSGVIAEYGDWRWVYLIAAALLVIATMSIPSIMESKRATGASQEPIGYFALVGSLFPLLARNREVLLSGMMQALNFGIFISVWLGLALHLTSEQMGYGTDTVGYLAAFAAVSIYMTPRLGRWADRVGPRKARMRMAFMQSLGVILLWPLGNSLIGLLVPIIVLNAVGPSIDVTSRMTFLSLAPDIRTRLMTAFIVMMFVGGGLASWAGTAVYEYAGWTGNAILAIGLSAVLLTLSFVAIALYGDRE